MIVTNLKGKKSFLIIHHGSTTNVSLLDITSIQQLIISLTIS